jgi:hypothetical protein
MIRLSSLIPINETGEGTSRPYPYKRLARSKNELVYRWKTESDLTYTLTLDKDQKEDIWKISFRTEETSYGDTNRGELYRVMSTVASIVKDEIRRTDRPTGIEWITTDPRKARIYSQYIKNAIGGVKGIERDGMYTVMFLKETGEGTSRPYRYYKIRSTPRVSEWTWKTESGLEYGLSATKETKDDDTTRWYISFSVNPQQVDQRIGKFGSTNRGEMFRIMATIVSAIRDQIRTEGMPDAIRWLSEPRRTGLYTQYIRRAFPKAKIVGSGDYIDVKLNQHLKETGEGSAKPYVGAKPVSRNQWGSVWSWTTDTGVDYELQIDKEGHPVWWISFEVKPTSKMKWRGAYTDVNRGEVWRVMATVSLIVKAELKRTKDRISIGFRGADERRARVFIRYIMATFPGSKLSAGSEGRYAKVELKPKK